MKCSYCGKEYIHGSKVCPFCYAKIGKASLDDADIIEEKKDDNDKCLFEVNQPNDDLTGTIGIVMSNTTTLPSVYNQKRIKEENSFRGIWKSLVVIVVLVICLVGLTMLLINNTSSNSSVEDDDEIVLASPEEDNTIKFLGYSLTMPTGFSHNVYEGVDYIQNEECVIMFKENDLDYDLISGNKEALTASLNAQGINVLSFVTKEVSGKNYALIVGELKESEATSGYVFGLIGDKSAIATIKSIDNKVFKNEWFNYVIKLFSSAI